MGHKSRMRGYALQELLHQNIGFSLYRARATESHTIPANQQNRLLVLKILHKDLPDPEELARLRSEWEQTPASEQMQANEHFSGVVSALELRNRGSVLVFADPGGDLLKSAMRRTGSLEDRLALAIALVRTVARLHQQDIIHKNLNPYTIFVRPSSDERIKYEVLLTGFEFTSRLSRQGSETIAPRILQGAPAYISPEQTGRMNQFVDQRSDLYSVGVLMYEMFTRYHPFPGARDTLEWVHCHIAREPVAIQTTGDDAQIPKALAGIIFKLLAKGSGERYQSARGLLTDLEFCHDVLLRTGVIPRFTPGVNDRPERLQLSQNLYGRTEELDRLLDDFAAVAAGARRLTFVTGASGTGKSVLIEEVRRPVVNQSGAFVTGKFDQFERGIPYHGLLLALGQMVRRILTEDNDTLTYWRQRILSALRSNAGILIPVIPDLAALLGPQPHVQDLSLAESRNRFQNVFGNFVAVFAGLHHPLVIFLDDLQWADPASLDFLQSLIQNLEIPYLHIIGSYRDTERIADSPLDRMLQRIEARPESAKFVQTIALVEFQVGDVLQLIVDSLDRPPATLRQLATVVHERTLGNPFFVRQFLFELYESGLLAFDHEHGEWRYDINAIVRTPVTHNAADFMARKIERLSYSATRSLQAAACLGGEFEWGMLHTVLTAISSGQSSSTEQKIDLAAGMAEALHEGLILSSGAASGGTPTVLFEPEFRFLHDRVQQAAYSLVPVEDRSRIHLAAARYMLDLSGDNDRDGEVKIPDDECLFEIVGHLHSANIGEHTGVDQFEPALAVRLNLEATRRARASGAISEALEFIHAAIDWQNHETSGRISQKLSSDVEFEAIQCEYLNGNHEAASAIFVRAYAKAVDESDRVRLTIVMVNLDTNLGRSGEAIERGTRALRELKLNVPAQPGTLRVLWQVNRVRWMLRGFNTENLIKHREMEDEDRLNQMDLLMSLAAAAFFKSQNLFAVIVLKMVELSLKFGNAPFSSYAYGTYAVLLQSAFGDSLAAAAFGRLALRLNERFDRNDLKCKLHLLYGGFINHWVDDIRKNEKYLQDAYAIGLENGDLIYAGYALANRIFFLVTIGRPLAEIDEAIRGFLKFVRRSGDRDVEGDFIISLQAARNLRGETFTRDSFSDDAYDENEHELQMQDGNPLTLLFYCLLQVRNRLIHRDLKEIRKFLRKGTAVLEPGRAMMLGPEFVYLRGLCEALCADAPRFARLYRLGHAIRQFETWSARSPQTFRTRLLHLKAERARLSGDLEAAARLYSQAVESALDAGNLSIAALAAEQAGRYYQGLQVLDMGRMYLERARYCYHIWGAIAKVAALEAEFSFLLENSDIVAAREQAAGDSADPRDRRPHFTDVGRIHTGQSTGVTSSGAMDVQSITRASRMISEEIVVARLLEKIMDLLLKEAGARRGCLIRRESDGDSNLSGGPVSETRYSIVARGGPDGVEVYSESSTTGFGRPALGFADLPQSLLQYVIRTGESVILNDVGRDRVYREDRYIQRTKPRSLLCMPIRARGEMTGILYLENDLAAGAFTEERLEILGILSAQAAVSLENAILYDGLEQRVTERTAELKETLARVQELKIAQDCDYYLTALLIQPLSATAINSTAIEIRSLIRQVKRFQYKKWSEQIGGDINVARSIQLQGHACTVFFQGDAMGKSLQGAGGALVFGAVVESLIAGTEVNVETAALPPDVWLMRSFQELHRVFESFHGYMLMSVMLGIIEDATGRIHMINGDHPPAVLYSEERAKFLDQVPITHKLGAHWYRRTVVNHQFQLEPGDTILLGSDGRDDLVIDRHGPGDYTMNEDANLFLQRVEEGQGDVERIYEAIKNFGEIKDDLSLMSVSYQSGATVGHKPDVIS